MKSRFVLGSFLFCSLLAACSSSTTEPGGPGGSSDPNNPSTPPSQNPGGNTTINGKTPEEYYGQFYNENKGAYLDGAASFSAQSNGDNLYLATLFVSKGKTFTLFYTEGKGEVTLTGHTAATHPDKNRRLTGAWSIGADGSLLLGDVMKCRAITINDRDSLTCAVTKAIGYEAAVGRAATLSPSTGKSPNDSTFADYK